MALEIGVILRIFATNARMNYCFIRAFVASK